MNLAKTFEMFNAGRCLVYGCILTFSILISLWMDGLIHWSLWAVFLPLWIWKCTVITGAVVGIVVWCFHPNSRSERVSFVNFRAMVISTSVHLLLLLFEILVCVRLETLSVFPWTLVFVPLLFISLLCILLCLWAIKNDRSFEMELICSTNVLQFVFIAIRLDNYVGWSWLLVFIPLWITAVIALIFMLYAVIIAIIMLRSAEMRTDHRHVGLCTALCYVFTIIPLVVYCVLLVERLDGLTLYSYSVMGIPLYISLATLMLMSFTSRSGNIWWFGLRKDCCQFILVDACPCLQEYGNISYKMQVNTSSTYGSRGDLRVAESTSQRYRSQKETFAPIVCIEMPD